MRKQFYSLALLFQPSSLFSVVVKKTAMTSSPASKTLKAPGLLPAYLLTGLMTLTAMDDQKPTSTERIQIVSRILFLCLIQVAVAKSGKAVMQAGSP